MAKFYTVEKEINGKNYKAQFSGLSTALEITDNSYIDGTDTTSVQKFAENIFEHIIVEPKVSVDDFNDMQELQEVIAFGRKVMQGEIKPETETKKENKK